MNQHSSLFLHVWISVLVQRFTLWINYMKQNFPIDFAISSLLQLKTSQTTTPVNWIHRNMLAYYMLADRQKLNLSAWCNTSATNLRSKHSALVIWSETWAEGESSSWQQVSLSALLLKTSDKNKNMQTNVPAPGILWRGAAGGRVPSGEPSVPGGRLYRGWPKLLLLQTPAPQCTKHTI